MFLICVTVGLVILASKYRKNVFRGIKHICHSLIRKSNNSNNLEKKEIKITLDKIILADSEEKCDYAVQQIRSNLRDGILGLDCEWVNESPVSLLQLATSNGLCALFRICKIGFIPFTLKELLANKRILKVGVAPFEDGQKITKDYKCKVLSTVDLRTLAERFKLPSPKSLAAMSLQYLNLEMDKIIEVRCGNWDTDSLTDEQVAYAACDANASVLIFHQIMQEAKQSLSFCQKVIIYLWSKWDEEIKYHGLLEDIIDVRFKGYHTNIIDANNNKYNKSNHINKSAEDLNTSTNVNSKTNIPTRNKPLYDNCYLQAPDGDILCTCDRKKAKWYVSKMLGEVVVEQPFTVRLTFEPSGRALGEVGQYYTQVKVNQCVVCGSAEKFIRKNVVPREYRKYFPVVMKAHQSHDVLLLCPTCHEVSNCHDLQLRRKLADMCDAPLVGPLTRTHDKDVNNFRKLHSAVKALREKATLPHWRRKELEYVVTECTGQQEITPILLDLLNEQLKNCLILSPATSLKHQPHGLKVVQHFEKEEGGLTELEKIWREHFLQTMKPRHLPSLWSVSHNQDRLAIRQTQNRIEPQDAKVAGLVY